MSRVDGVSKKLAALNVPKTGDDSRCVNKPLHHKCIQTVEDDVIDQVFRLPDPANELLVYYRHKVNSLIDDHKSLESRLDDIAADLNSQAELKSEIRHRESELLEMQRTFSDMQVHLFQERDRVLRLYAENDDLKLSELKSRQKLKDLLRHPCFCRQSVTNLPKNTEVPNSGSFAQGDQPEISLSRERDVSIDTVKGNLVAHNGVNAPSADGEILMKPSDLVSSPRAECGPTLNEIGITELSLRSLRAQFVEQTRAAQEQIDSLLEDRQVTHETMHQLHSHYENQLNALEEQLRHYQALLHENTVDLLSRRQQFELAERAWITEKAELLNARDSRKVFFPVPCIAATEEPSMSGTCEIGESGLMEPHTSPAVIALPTCETQEKSKSLHSLRTVVRNLERQIDQQRKLCEMYRNQAVRFEEQLLHCREEAAVSKDSFQKILNNLNERLEIMTRRYHSLQERRQLEIQGYRTDIDNLRKKLRDFETLLQIGLGRCGDKLYEPDTDLAILKHVKASTKRSKQLMDEMKNLKLKMYNLEDEVRKI